MRYFSFAVTRTPTFLMGSHCCVLSHLWNSCPFPALPQGFDLYKCVFWPVCVCVCLCLCVCEYADAAEGGPAPRWERWWGGRCGCGDKTHPLLSSWHVSPAGDGLHLVHFSVRAKCGFYFCLLLFWTLPWSKCDDKNPPSYSGTRDFTAVYLVPAFPGVKPASDWCHFFGWLGPRCDQAALSDREDLHSDFLKWFVFSLARALPADGRYLLAGAEVTCLSFTFFGG